MKLFVVVLLLQLFPKLDWCLSEPQLSKKTLTIGVLYWSLDIPGQVAMRKGLEDEVKKINKSALLDQKPQIKILSYVAGNGEAGIENQKKQMGILLSKKVDGIVVQPTDNAALVNLLFKANNLKIPVVAYDQYIVKGKLVSYITSDNYQAGYYDGLYVASLFPDDQVIKVILVEYPYVSSTVERVDGFIDALKENRQKFQIIKNVEAVEPVGGQKAAEIILKQYPQRNSIDVIFSVNDGGGYALETVIKKAKRNEIVFASVDGDPKAIQQIESAENKKIDTAQFCGPMGAEAISILYRHLLNESVPPKVLIPVFPITSETIKMYPGWQGPIPKTFSLPWDKSVKWNNKMRID